MTSRWPPTFEPQELIASLRRQPLLLVFRPKAPLQLAPVLEQLQALGLVHVEIASLPNDDWGAQCRQLTKSFPRLRLGAASIVSREALEVVLEAGFAYGVSPIFERGLQEQAASARFLLVPGVMTPSEVQAAGHWGPGLVKLFPAATLGLGYWSRLREPLGGDLPFCIAAGGIALGEVSQWLASGVDAVAVGSRWLGVEGSFAKEAMDLAPLRALLAELPLQC